METRIATDLLTVLAHEGRLDVFRLLVRRLPDGLRPGEMAEALGLKASTLSQYLSALEGAGLVHSTRRGKAVHYRPDVARLGELVDFLFVDCGRGRPELGHRQDGGGKAQAPFNVLFICTGNSARSIFAETLLRDLGGARFRAHSAGTQPATGPNPVALDLLQRQGHDLAGLRSKSLVEFQGPDAPKMDFVFTVCDFAANEACPPWPGQPHSAHWGLPDPVKAQGTEAEKALAFAQTYAAMRRRVEAFVNLPFTSLDAMSLQGRLDEISNLDE